VETFVVECTVNGDGGGRAEVKNEREQRKGTPLYIVVVATAGFI
jgi:hypothetical protein